MAKIKSIDQAVVVTSELTNEQLAKASKYFPEVLTLKEKNDDGKLVPVFAVGISDKGSITRSGIEFPKGPKADKASVTVNIPKMEKAKRVELIKDAYGLVLVRLNQIEKAYADAEKSFDEQYKSLDKDIVVE